LSVSKQLGFRKSLHCQSSFGRTGTARRWRQKFRTWTWAAKVCCQGFKASLRETFRELL